MVPVSWFGVRPDEPTGVHFRGTELARTARPVRILARAHPEPATFAEAPTAMGNGCFGLQSRLG